ncbi:MAG: alkyl hydroperoxide reductase [Anaerolineae bacterium]|nr:alkyl hydroperoxide reductase [Gemmatimonadaceae bacterium]
MRELEQRFPSEIAVVGVHSGKYHAERITERIREAVNRFGVVHPVVNDRQFRIWRSYAVNAWPTLQIVDPTGRVLGGQAGEFTADRLSPVIQQLVEAFGSAGELVRTAIPETLDQPKILPGTLRYPGKIELDGDRIAIADSGHNRVLTGRLSSDGTSARIDRVIGTGEPVFRDGTKGAFNSPQGMAFEGDTLYVADAANHAVRTVDLRSGAIATLAGTGHQLRTAADLQAGAMSSPWDVAVADGTVFIAMAGVHQLWSVELSTGTGMRHSGSQREDIADGQHFDAALAQPMGVLAHADKLYFVDAESSAVRMADTEQDGSVATLVGTGLFDFGDIDGIGDVVRMQHQQGIARHRDGRLLIADSYNDSLKWLDPVTRRAETWVRGLHEPGGVACGERFAYVADTNAHRIALVDYRNHETGVLKLEL